MTPRKLEFASDVIRIISDLCSVIFNIKSENDLENLFGINHDQMESTINKIVAALPDHFFEQLYPPLLDEIKNICAREFIFFQAQERWNEVHYQQNLLHFIYIFTRDIQRRMNANKQSQAKLREE